MKYYLISNICVDVGINNLECCRVAECLEWHENTLLGAADNEAEKVDDLFCGLIFFFSPTKDEDEVLEELKCHLRDKRHICTDIITVEFDEEAKRPFKAVEVTHAKDGIIEMANQCNNCGKFVYDTIGIKDYFAGKKPICPECGKPYIPCDDCRWFVNCDDCPFKKA